MKNKNFSINTDILNLISPKYLFNDMLSKIKIEIVIIDSDGFIRYANDCAIKALGYSAKDVVGKSISKFIHPKMSRKAWQATRFNKLSKEKKPTSAVVERVVRDGSIQVIEICAFFFKYNGKEYMLSSSKNITENKDLQAKLAESETLFRFFTEQAADAIFTVDLKGYLLYANKAAEKITKVPFSVAKGKDFMEFISEGSKSFARNVFSTVKKGKPVILGEMEILDKHGNNIPIEFTSTPIFKDGKIFQLHTIFRDISAKKELDSLLRQSEKNEAVQQFISGTSQEIQSPLRGIFENTENLISKYKYRDYEYIGFKEFKDIITTLEHMRDQVKYCCDTNKRLLTISKKKAGLKINNCDAAVVLKGVLSGLKTTMDISDIKLVLKISKNIPFAAIGSVELNQVIANILTNSVQAISNKGVIDIKISHLRDEGMVSIVIKDNGVGIQRDILPKVYDPFFTTKSRGLEKSSGLGLSIVYSIIKAVKGEISIRSSPRRGTRIQLKIPTYKNGHK